MAVVAGTKVGTGFVDIEPNFAGFQEAVGKRLNQALAPALRKAGGNVGKDMARGLDRGNLGRALAPLLQRFERFGDDAGKAIATRISKGSKRAAGDMFGLADAVAEVEKQTRKARAGARASDNDMFGINRAARESGKGLRSVRTSLRDYHAQVEAAKGGTRRFSERLKGISGELRGFGRGLRVTSSGFGGFDGIMARTNRGFSFFRNLLRTFKWPIFIAGLGLSLQGLSALAAGAVTAAGSLGRLSGVLVVLPAAALAAAQAFSVLKLATAGIGDALKAGLDAEIQGGQQAVDTMRQQEDAAERVADAKRNLTEVQKQALIAQEDLTQARADARRELEDMRLASEASDDAEQQGSLSLVQARKDLARTLRDADATGLDVRFAEEAVDQARNDLESTRVEAKRAREDYRDAKKSGVDGMPSVVAAKQAEADANQAVTDANRDLEKAVRDSTDAMKEQGSAASAFQDKMSQLPPAAQKFVRVLLSMKPRLDELRSTAASNFFPGAESGLKSLMGNFGRVKAVVGDTAGVLGKIASKAGKKLGSAVWGKDLSRLGELNTRILDRMGVSGLNLADSLRHVLVSAEPFLDWLSGSTLKLTEWVKGEAAARRETGQFGEFFDRTRQTMERLGPILKGVSGAFLNISKASDDLGNDILESLGGAAEGWREWTDSVQGQNRLKNYFTETKPAVFEMGRLVRDAGKAFFELGKQRGVAHLLRLVRTELIPALRDLVGTTTGWASGFLKQFGQLRNQGVPAFDAFVRTLAEHAGQAAVTIASAIVRSFLGASIWGKLAIGGWLLAKFGGKGQILAAGSMLGRWLGIGVSGGIASGAAGGAIAATGGSAAGGIAGGLMTKLKGVKWARIGALGIGVTLADEIMGSLSRRAQERSSDLVDALSGIEGSTGIFDAGLTQNRSDLQREAGLASNLKAQFEEMGRKRLQLSAATVESLRAQGRELDLSKQARAQLERMLELARSGRRLGTNVDLGIDPERVQRIGREFAFLKRGVGSSMKDIARVSQRAGRLIVTTFGAGAKEARELTSRNMRLTATAMAQQMTRSGNITKEGMERIRNLIRTADLLSPTRKQARDFGREWAKGMDQTKEVTAKGFNAMIAEARKMPAPMRQAALQTWFEQVRQARKSGDLTADAFRTMRSRLFSEFGTIKRDSKVFNREFAKSFVDMTNESGGAIGILMANLSGALKALNGKAEFNFSVKKAGGGEGSPVKRQKGGSVPSKLVTGGLASMVPGNSTGDRHTLSLNGTPVAKVESKEGIFVGNRNLMAAMGQANAAVPRFQNGGLVDGAVQRLRRGGLVEPKLEGEGGSLKEMGQSAIHKVFEGAKEFLAKHKPQLGGGMTGSGPVEAVFAKVAKALSKSKIATLALGMAGFAETRMRDLPGGHSSSSGSLQLLAETASAFGIDPHDEAAVSSHFLLRGFYGRGGANKLAAQGLPAHLVAQNVQGSAFSDGSNYLAQEGAAKGWMKRFGLQAGGLVKLAKGGELGNPFNAQAMRGGPASGASLLSGLTGFKPKTIGRIKSKAEAIANAFTGYVWGGGHSEGTNVTANGLDCSGAIAKLMQQAGWPEFAVGHSSEYASRFMSGEGDLFTIWSNNDHTFADIEGQQWGTNTSTGLGYHSHTHAGFTPRHPQLAPEGATGTAATSPGAKPKEEIPATYKGAKTGQLDFGAMPKNLDGVKAALKTWEREAGKYRKARAHAEKDGKPGIAQAVARNLAAIEQRLTALRQQHTRLRVAGVRKALKKRLDKASGRFAGYDQIIEGSQRSYDAAAQYAEQVVALEPQSPEISPQAKGESDKAYADRQEAAEKAYVANLTGYVDGPERNAFGEVLGKVADWRNNILKAEMFGFGKGSPSVLASSSAWEGQAFNARGRIEQINDFTAEVAKRVATFRKNNPKTAFPGWLKGMIGTRDRMREQLPVLQMKNTQLTEAVGRAREMFFPGGKNRIKPPPLPLPGSGSLEEKLTEVQGIHWPDHHELLPAGALAPPRVAGRFGGVVWDVQSSIEELGLKIRQATNGLGSPTDSDDASSSELKELEAQLNTDWRKRFIASELQEGVGRLFKETYPVGFPFAGTFHSGGITPGPQTRESVALVRGQERIRTPEQELEMAEAIREQATGADGGSTGGVVIEQIVLHEDGRATVRIDGQDFEQAVRRVVRSAPGTGRLTPGGARGF